MVEIFKKRTTISGVPELSLQTESALTFNLENNVFSIHSVNQSLQRSTFKYEDVLLN